MPFDLTSFLMGKGQGGTSGPVEGTDIKSTGVSSGKVLTADGSGGASWTTVGGGSDASVCFIDFDWDNILDDRFIFSEHSIDDYYRQVQESFKPLVFRCIPPRDIMWLTTSWMPGYQFVNSILLDSDTLQQQGYKVPVQFYSGMYDSEIYPIFEDNDPESPTHIYNRHFYMDLS